MILQKLADYYDRIAADPATADVLPKPGYSLQQISFAVVLKADGTLHGFQSVHDGNEKKPRPQKLLVPGQSHPSGTALTPRFLWDSSAYMLGYTSDDPDEPRTREKFAAYQAYHVALADRVDDPAFKAVCRFLERWSPERAKEHAAELDRVAGNFGVFKIAGEPQYIHQNPPVIAFWSDQSASTSEPERLREGMCLVTGRVELLARKHEPQIKGVAGSQSSGALLVSYNADAYESYGKDKGENGYVGVASTFKYTNALNYLLSRPDRRTGLGDATYTYWADRPTPLETFFDPIFGDAPLPKADAKPEDKQRAEQVRTFLEQLRDGHAAGDAFDRDAGVGFYVLGLSPNASRLSVRLWEQSTVGEMEARLGRHLQDMHLVGQRDGDPPLVVRRVVEATGRAKTSNGTSQGYDADAVSPVLAGAIARAVLTGGPYPASLLTAMLNRIRADGHVSHPRVAAVKALLVRGDRTRFPTKEALVSLDTDRTDPAYVTGRLFALLERIQEDASGDLNATIKDRYFSAASATPGGVFPRLIRLSQHHLSGLGKEKAGLKVNRDKLYGEIMGKLDGFAPQFGLEDQGLFAVGYYHQRQDFYTKKAADKAKDEGDTE